MLVEWSLLRWIKMGSLLPGTRDGIPMTGTKKAQKKKGDGLKNQPEIFSAWDRTETLSWLRKTCKNLNKRGKTNDKLRQIHKQKVVSSVYCFQQPELCCHFTYGRVCAGILNAINTTTKNNVLSRAIQLVGKQSNPTWTSFENLTINTSYLQKATGIYINQLIIFQVTE